MKTDRIAKTTKTVLIALLLITAMKLMLTGRHIQSKLRAKAVSTIAQTPYQAPEDLTETSIDYDAVLRADLFNAGELTSEGATSLSNTDSATPSNLKLVGTITGSPSVARAIIYDSDTPSPPKAYRLKDSLGSGIIEAIRKDEVVLRYHGQRKILRRSSGKTANIAKTVTEQKPPPSGSAPKKEYKVVPVSLPAQQAPALEELLHKTKIKSHIVDGHTEGLEVAGIENVPIAQKLGLRNGDIIRVVNGQSLSSRQKAFQVLRKAKTQDKLTIELTREDRYRVLSFDLK